MTNSFDYFFFCGGRGYNPDLAYYVLSILSELSLRGHSFDYFTKTKECINVSKKKVHNNK